MPTPSSSRVTRTWVNAGSAVMVSIRSPSHLSGRLATRSMPARFSPSTMSGVGLAAAPAAASLMAPPELGSVVTTAYRFGRAKPEGAVRYYGLGGAGQVVSGKCLAFEPDGSPCVEPALPWLPHCAPHAIVHAPAPRLVRRALRRAIARSDLYLA